MNFISCTPVRANGDMVLHLKEIDARVPLSQAVRKTIEEAKEVDRDLVLGVRPEHVLFSRSRREDFVETKVFAIEKTGSYNIIDVKLGKEIIRVRTGPTVVPKVEDRVYIGFDMDGISLFDRETESSIMR
jgi:ABC-type sugar transport system ATPase subunit